MSRDSDELCGQCNGSGEGQYDGSRCNTCGGSGVVRDCETEYERQCEAADHYNDMMKDR